MSACSTRGCAFTPIGRRTRCQACLARAATVAATKAREERAGKPRIAAAAPRVSLLVADGRPALVVRRRGDCARLAGCEEAWVLAHAKTNVGAQAKCPNGCPGYVRRSA